MKKVIAICILLIECFCFISAATEEVDEVAELQKRRDTLTYGLESEITGLLDTLIKEEDTSLSDEIYKIFLTSKNVNVKDKIITYYTTNKDSRLSDFAVQVISDPYDEEKSTINLLIKYCGTLKINEVAPYLTDILENEQEDYYDAALSALGECGGPEEALFLADFLENDTLSTARKQNLMKALGAIHAVETWDKLVEIIEDEDQNTYVRMYAAEAIGVMEKEESIPVLIRLFQNNDSNLRTYAVKGLSYFNTAEVEQFMIEALRDNYYKVRLEAVKAAGKWDFKACLPSLIYRAKNDSESTVKYECYTTLGMLEEQEAFDFLIEVLQDEKKGDAARSKAAEVLLKEGNDAAIKLVVDLAQACLGDDKKKTLRYNIGKELAKYENSSFRAICQGFLESKDASTQGIGIDIFNKNGFSDLIPQVQAIADNQKSGLKTKAKLALEKAGVTTSETAASE